MLCSLCQDAKIDGKATGAVWECPCGETHCRHIDKCPVCGLDRRAPARGDYLGLGGERHTTIDRTHRWDRDAWLVEDNTGEDFRVVRDPDNDNDVRRAWRLAD